ncbi:MAG: hypothetical protein Q8J90_07340 [Gallionella sp.]|nr:hypothetical protein [Gallionella sp.]
MLTTIEVTIDKTGHLHSVESGQTIKPGRALLTWLEPDTVKNDGYRYTLPILPR